MDWSRYVATARRMIADKGIAMTVCKLVDGVYNVTTDSIGATLTSYSTIGVLTNPIVKTAEGEYSKSDSIRLVLAASGLPTLDRINYKVVCGDDVWFPKSTKAIKPGGTPIIYLADMK